MAQNVDIDLMNGDEFSPEALRQAKSVANRLTGGALEILEQFWTAHVNAKPGSPYRYVKYMYVGRALYEGYEESLDMRARYYDESVGIFGGGLKYRGATLIIRGEGWGVEFEDDE